MSMRVIALSMDQLDEATEVLALAFEEYPLVRYFLAGQGAAYAQRLREMFRLTCRYRLLVGWPPAGVLRGGKLAAVACVTGTDEPPEPPEMAELEQAFVSRMGPQAAERIEEYVEVKQRNLPAEPHHYLTAIGVHPEARGIGCARALLDYVHALSQSDATSMGVALDTQTPSNVALYEHFGYRQTAETKVGDVPTWCMYRPNDPR